MTKLPADSSRDYARIAEAIAWLHAHRREQPDLAALARHLNLSEPHLQRLFTRWAGISPKWFLQTLTLEYARTQLAATRDVLSLSLAAGLSGPGRLHDLFVTLDAVSPGEAKSGGLGLTIRHGVHPTPFGEALIAASARGICKLHFLADGDDPESLLRADWPFATLHADAAATAPLIATIFHAARPTAPLALWVKGSNFQFQVWRALLAIPPGGLTTYRTLAETIGHPRAARAVGNAVAANPLAYLIPCHRVIRESGALGGYRWGLVRKNAIQGWESGGDG
ncbi:methylated-DNA--[protein]-cysteine S-methyltransferase [Thiobacillus sp.]|uniref:methylated-DNA--[protein]-cysteine S-methyltransferase n=1 Tax=Thiobacillus sp. TaxID=924 RepID=UPI00286E2E4E|nr:methylated-DNA--[protein]-cysteine S-methyltransferase [Thiobacillus sp.]